MTVFLSTCRLWWYLWLHRPDHLSGWRWNSALRLLSFPGNHTLIGWSLCLLDKMSFQMVTCVLTGLRKVNQWDCFSFLQGSVPPVMAFHLGSLGFLTPFKFESYKTEVAKVFEGRLQLYMKYHHLCVAVLTCTSACVFSGNAAITLRSRLKVKVVKDMLQRTGQQSYSREPPQQQQEHNGLLPHGHTNSEAGKVTLQLQVRTKVSSFTEAFSADQCKKISVHCNSRKFLRDSGTFPAFWPKQPETNLIPLL